MLLKIKPVFTPASSRMFNPEKLRMYTAELKCHRRRCCLTLAILPGPKFKNELYIRSNIGAGMFLSNFDPKVHL